MLLYRWFLSFALLTSALGTGWGRVALGQEKPKPFATVSIAPLDRSLPDLTYILSALNMPEMTGMVEMMAGFYTKGIDRSRPIGVFLTMADGQDAEPEFQACIPMTDHQQWFQAIAGMGLEPEDLGEGKYEIAAAGQFIYAKVADGWLHMGQSEESLSEVVQNPTELLGDLPQRYNLAVRLDLEQISPEARRSALDQMRSQVEQNVAQQFGDQLGEQLDLAKEAGEAQLEELEEVMKDVQQIVLGFLTESDQKRVAIDAAIQFLPGTELAAQMESQAGLRSEFAGLQVAESAAQVRLTGAMAKDQDKAAAKLALQEFLKQVEQAMQRTELPEQRAGLLKQLMASCTKVLEQTIDEGLVDGAAALSYHDDVLRVLAGVRVADGRAIENELKSFISGLTAASEIQFEPDYATEGSWRLHRLRAQLPDSEDSIGSLLGQEIEIFIAASDKKLLVSLAPDGEESLRSAIRQMDSAQPVEVTPMEVVLKVGDLVRLMQKANPDPSMEEMLAAVEQVESNDQVKVTATVLPRGFVVRASIEEGVLKTLGSMVKSSDLMPGF
jgi:hypothetical protein